ncbi:PhzF family phenazine biosynthesis protein [Algiphilus sp.]|uniref:PhzF family phenazine biosynthesis protein n=1 Tax=Algiphilus sp. TaxID=1872431 RepID=UPI003C389FB2
MQLRQFQVDAFTDRLFGGNPAAVVPLTEWLDDATLQAVAMENQLSETAFFVAEGDGYRLRWFTPTREVDLCGHATLASAHVLYAHLDRDDPEVRFHTRSGVLTVRPDGRELWMDFPAAPAETATAPPALVSGLGSAPSAVLAADDWLAVFEDADGVRALAPDMAQLATLDRRGVIVTAPGDGDSDFVSRFFAPRYGIPEDPVTGSAHCTLAPYWAERLGRDTLRARQISARGGEVACRVADGRVRIGGRAVTFLDGRITLPDA